MQPKHLSQREVTVQAQLAEQERQRQQKMQATKFIQRQAAIAATSDAVNDAGTAAVSQILQTAQDGGQSLDAATAPMLEDAAVKVEVSEALSPVGDSTSGRKRRRTTVDYVALNKQLEAEAAGVPVQSAQQQPSLSAPSGLSFVTNAPASTVAVHANNTAPHSASDSAANGTALNVEQQQTIAQQPREGDRMQ